MLDRPPAPEAFPLCEAGGISRSASLRGYWAKHPWGFNSPSSHFRDVAFPCSRAELSLRFGSEGRFPGPTTLEQARLKLGEAPQLALSFRRQPPPVPGIKLALDAGFPAIRRHPGPLRLRGARVTADVDQRWRPRPARPRVRAFLSEVYRIAYPTHDRVEQEVRLDGEVDDGRLLRREYVRYVRFRFCRPALLRRNRLVILLG